MEQFFSSQLDKTNKRLTNEVDDLNLELDKYRQQMTMMDKKQRQFDKALADERQISTKYADEKDRAVREAMEKEARAISLMDQCESLMAKVGITTLQI